MLAKDLKELVKKQGAITVRVIAVPEHEGEGNMSDFGASVASISTYLRTGMMADITDACAMPVIHPLLDDAKLYRDAMEQGHIYFVFHHQPYLEQNEKVAEPNWQNDNPGAGEVAEGTAVQIGCYSGYDMIGFPPDEDMSKLLEIVTKD